MKSVYPVQTLREYAKALEAAMTVAATSSGKDAVHDLRSMTRRLEAQISLLMQMEALPADAPEAAQLRRDVRTLRRAAGRVRDLDVLRALLKDNLSLPQQNAAELREELKKARKRKAKKLRALLLSNLPKVVASIEQVLSSVGTANGMAVPAISLVPLIERWRQAQPDGERPEGTADEHLHATRKVAKLARYMAESVEDNHDAAAAAERYEAQQDAGGQWHDWLELAETSRKHFGKKHPLTVAAVEQTEAAKQEFLRVLDRSILPVSR